MLRIDALRTLVAVAEAGTLRGAAARLGRTQSAVSMTLRQLEDSLGGALFETDRKRSLSALGQFVHAVAVDLLAAHDTAIATIEAYAGGRTGRLDIASVPSVAARLLPAILHDFLQAQDGATVDLVDSDSATVRDHVARGHADIGLASAGPRMDGLDSTPVLRDRLLLVCAADHPLARLGDAPGWAALDGAGLIMNEALRPLAAAAPLRALAAQSRLSVRNTLSLLAMVRAGAGVTLLPGLATLDLAPGLVARPLAGDGLVRTLCLLTPAGRRPSPLARAMADRLRVDLPALAARHGPPLMGP